MQACPQLLMIRPVHFGYNVQTAVNNAFQQNKEPVHEMAIAEFDAFLRLLRRNKINVLVVDDTSDPLTPDSTFPNNWISFHRNGQVYLYPMFAPNRRQERKPHVLEAIKKQFSITGITDLSVYEDQGLFLEGTGSMVLDRVNRIAYACRSVRTSETVLEAFCKLAGYMPCIFNATDQRGIPIYHTNVMMCMADRFVVICLDSVTAANEKEKLLQHFEQANKQVIPITQDQLDHFAGNMLQVKNNDGNPVLIMSSQACHSLSEEQIAMLEKYNPILHAPLDTIESAGGGSARCMLAEIFLNPA